MKTLLAYYSYTGHTEMISKMINEETDCDTYRIKPVNEYSSDYNSVVNETEDNLKSQNTPEIEELNLNLDEYDKIILGTPVWWYTIAPPVRSFLKKYDLNNKILIPYATNAGWLGQTFNEIKEITDARILNEKSIKFTTDYSENKLVTSKEEINKWINEIKNI